MLRKTTCIILCIAFSSLLTAGSLETDFQSPPETAKPSGYWWWLNGNVDKEAITRDMEEFKAKGMGAVLLVSSGQWGGHMPVNGPEFLSDEWRELYKHALKEAHRVGIKVDVNIAPGWNMGGPWVTPDKACRWFLQSQTTVKGPQKFSGKLPLPGGKDGYNSPPQLGVKSYINLPLEELDYRDTAVVAFRTPENAQGEVGPNQRKDLPAKSNRVDANCFKPVSDVMSETLFFWQTSEGDLPIRAEDVVDLTEKLKEDGTLVWDVPDGDWTIVRTGHRMTGAKLSVPMPGQGGLENDYLDRAGVELMFEKVGKVLIEDAGPLAGNTLRGFCSDSFECGYPNWTANMIKHFKNYRGYDPVPYLPVFKGWIVGSAEVSDRFLHDYRKTVADCMAEEHYGRFTELCRQNGLMTRCESAGPSWSSTMCMDGLKNLGRVDFPQGEFWRKLFIQNGQNMVGKQTATASHIYGKRTASAEAFTIGGNHWTGSPQILKPVADMAFCEGINCFVFHTTTCQRPVDGKPGYEYGAGTHFNPNVTWWDNAAGAWIGYINRCQAMLQSGLFVADVLYYNGDWAPNLVGPRYIDPSLGKGYDYDVCNADVLLNRLSVKDGKLVLPDGMSYRLLSLPDTKRMPVEVIEKIESLVKAGATVVGPKPESDPGLKDYPNCDAAVRKIAEALWGNIDGKTIVEHQAGSGRVIWGKSLQDVLLSDGVNPDFEVAGQDGVYIDFIHRAATDADFYFLANRNDRPESVKVTFRQDGRQPELWDPVTGQQRNLPKFTIKDGRTTVLLEFERYGSMFIVFLKPIQKTSGKNFAEFKPVQQVTGPWTVQFDKEWFYPVDGLSGKQAQGEFVFDKLVDWTERPEDAVRHYSGTAKYSKEFTVKQVDGNGKYLLDLGVVNVTASVRLNGIDLGAVWCSPWRVDVSKAIKNGVNKLEIEVANLWPNRLIGDGKLPEDQRRTRTNITHYYRKPRDGGEHKLLPSGLLGPVALMTEGELLRPVSLRCEYLTDPIGVDVKKPRLSWQLKSDQRGQKQSAYRLLVASSRQKLDKDIGDLWDSGVVKSSQSIHVAYDGKPLVSDRHYYWKVKVWDKDGVPSNFSQAAFWETGLLIPGDWKGKWIGDSTQQKIEADNKTTQAQPSPRFRKSFDLGKPIKDATLFISGVGYFEAWLNGKRIGDHVLDPAFTRYDKRVLYVTHDVSDQLVKGDNTIGVQLGNGWYNMHTRAVWDFDKAPWRDSPRTIMQLNVTYTDGSVESVFTDKTWRMSTGPFVFDSIRNGEVYDARLETGGWDKQNFDDSRWEQADEVPAPKGFLCSQLMPPIRVTQTIKAKSLSEPKPGIFVFDIGQNMPGWVKFKVKGPRGTKVTLRYSEVLDDKGMIDTRAIEKHIRSGHIQEDTYILKGEGIEERQTHFSYHGFQYVEISGLPEKPSLDDIEGIVVHTDFETIGKFECSNKLINDIHNLALWSYRSNYHGYPTDCPHREKNGWSGDAHLAAEMGLFNFHQAPSYTKWLDDWSDEQQPDGTLAAIIPTSGWGYKWGNGPAWDSAYVLIPWYIYLYNGETRILEKHYEGMRKYVDRMGKWAGKNEYIIEYGLGDWCPAKSKTSCDLTSTGYYYTDALIISKVAGILGKIEDQKKYAQLADKIRKAFNKNFYKGADSGVYDNGTQTGNSCALYQGLAEENQIPHIVNKLVANIKENDEHLDVGILGSKYLFNALTENGQHDLAYRIATKTTSPSYGHWFELGATTMWESWHDKPEWVSYNHIMFGDIDAWFYKNLGGINYDPEMPGFKNIIIHPRPTGDLTWAKAQHHSPYGLIKTNWKIKNNKFYLDVTIPVNSTATVYVPGKNITETGLPAAESEGVTFLRMDKNEAVFSVGSGGYEFVSNNYQGD